MPPFATFNRSCDYTMYTFININSSHKSNFRLWCSFQVQIKLVCNTNNIINTTVILIEFRIWSRNLKNSAWMDHVIMAHLEHSVICILQWHQHVYPFHSVRTFTMHTMNEMQLSPKMDYTEHENILTEIHWKVNKHFSKGYSCHFGNT